VELPSRTPPKLAFNLHPKKHSQHAVTRKKKQMGSNSIFYIIGVIVVVVVVLKLLGLW